MEIYFDDRSGRDIPEEIADKIERVILKGLERAETGGKASLEISVSFVLPEEIKKLNKDYRGKDSVTDVLSFPAGADFRDMPAGFPVMLGDIVICPERAAEQADEYGHGFEREMCFLAAHGLLHILGYDHGEESEEQTMLAEQDAILNSLGIVR